MSLSNISPKAYSLSAVVVGYLLIDDLDANSQNALGNWLMLVAQLLCTNAVFKQLDENNSNSMTNNDTISMLEKMIKALNKEVNDLKSNLK